MKSKTEAARTPTPTVAISSPHTPPGVNDIFQQNGQSVRFLTDIVTHGSCFRERRKQVVEDGCLTSEEVRCLLVRASNLLAILLWRHRDSLTTSEGEVAADICEELVQSGLADATTHSLRARVYIHLGKLQQAETAIACFKRTEETSGEGKVYKNKVQSLNSLHAYCE